MLGRGSRGTAGLRERVLLLAGQMASAREGEDEEWPQDGTCDACEPDEAPAAAQTCQDCGFSFCRLHAAEHRQKYRAHRMTEFASQEASGPEPTREEPAKVERKKCEEHGEDLSLYCREHEKIICVLCAVSGPHQKHEIITLNDAYEALRVSSLEPGA